MNGTCPKAEDAPLLIGSTQFETLPGIHTILITGGAGFIASYVVRHFVVQYPQYRVICYDKLDYCASTNNFKALEKMENFAFEEGDIADAERTLEVMKKHNVDAVMHFAAQSHVDLSFGNSYSFTQNNVLGSHVLLECAKYMKVKRFIHVSTDEVYGEVAHQEEDVLETALLCPTNPYAASKAAADMIANAYYKSFKLPIIIVRSNNVYGPHQFPEKIIPKFTCLLARGKKVVLHGDGSPTRRYLFASDAADAFDTIFHKGDIGQIYNIGSRDEISNKEMCGILFKAFGIPEEEWSNWIEHVQNRPFNDMRYAVDGQKLMQLGWRQKVPFDQGLRLTVEWYRQFGESWWGDITDYLEPFPLQKQVASPPKAMKKHGQVLTQAPLPNVL
jgi:dTDP-glucose 4,6-dehydratase